MSTLLALIPIDHTGATPLQEAVKNGHLDVVKALLDKGSHSILDRVACD